MRITNGMLVNNMMNNLNSNLNRLERYQNQGASGRKFDKPSDDPIGMSRSLKLYTDVSKVNQYERNLNDANSWMHTTEEALKEMEQILQRTRELSVDAANGIKTGDDTSKIAEEIKQLKQQVIKLGNTRHAGRSIFTGFKTDEDLFKQPSGVYNISINKDDVSVYNVGISEDIDVNIVGIRVFGTVSNVDILENNLKGNLVIDKELDKDGNLVEVTDDTVTKAMKRRKSDNLHEVKSQLKEAVDKGAKFTMKDVKDPIDSVVKDIVIDASSMTEDQKNVARAQIDNLILSYDNLPTDEAEITNIKEKLSIDDTNDNIKKPDDLWLNIMENNGKIEVDATKGFSNSQSNENDKSSIMQMFDNLISAMDRGEHEEINGQLKDIDKVHGNIVSIKAEIGAKTNRLEMTEKRLSSEKLNFEDNLSKNEDVDYAELIMKSQLAQNIYQASLAIGSKVIQPTLMDFLR